MPFDATNTSVEEIHDIISDTAVDIAHDIIDQDRRIPRKWKGPVFRNGSPYNDGRLCLEITEEYQSAPDKVKKLYHQAARLGIQRSVVYHQELFAGMIFGEARAGRNYFDRWSQAPTALFD
jgi:hypothetical protein